MTKITREQLTTDSQTLFDRGQLDIHDDCVLRLQPDGSYVREEFADHIAAAEESPKRGRAKDDATETAVKSDD